MSEDLVGTLPTSSRLLLKKTGFALLRLLPTSTSRADRYRQDVGNSGVTHILHPSTTDKAILWKSAGKQITGIKKEIIIKKTTYFRDAFGT